MAEARFGKMSAFTKFGPPTSGVRLERPRVSVAKLQKIFSLPAFNKLCCKFVHFAVRKSPNKLKF